MSPLPSPQRSILVVDDQPAEIDVMVAALGEEYAVTAAKSGARALEIARSAEPPDLILLDVVMPEMDGYETCARLKADPVTASIPVIFVTVRDDIGDEERGFSVGAVDYITKPLKPALVRARAKTHIALYRSAQSLDQLVLERTAELESARHQLRQLASEMALAEERERRRLAVLLHDGPTQELVAAKLFMNSGADGDAAERAEALTRANDLLDSAIDQSRNLCFEMSPQLLYDQGLDAALDWLARKHARETNVSLSFDRTGEPRRLPHDLAVTVYQCARELLQNVAKHASASQVELRMEWTDNSLRMKVIDDGVGFRAHQKARAGADGMAIPAGSEDDFLVPLGPLLDATGPGSGGDPGAQGGSRTQGGFGLFSIRDRVDLVGGTLRIRSEDSTEVSIEIPALV